MHVKKQKKETRARATLPEKLPPASDASNPGMLEQGKTTFEPQQPCAPKKFAKIKRKQL